MTVSLSAGPEATPEDRAIGQAQARLLRDELPRVRAAAASWRTGLGGLLAALAGFGLVQGRTDIDELATPYRWLVGALLLGAVVCGAAGGLCLLRAAHGRLRAQPASRLTSVALADHQEAVGALRGLRRGVAFTIVCASFLVGAVGFTWYGPSRLPPTVLIETDSGVVCGTVERSGAGRVAIETGSGVRDVSFDDIDGLRTVDCGARP